MSLCYSVIGFLEKIFLGKAWGHGQIGPGPSKSASNYLSILITIRQSLNEKL